MNSTDNMMASLLELGHDYDEERDGSARYLRVKEVSGIWYTFWHNSPHDYHAVTAEGLTFSEAVTNLINALLDVAPKSTVRVA